MMNYFIVAIVRCVAAYLSLPSIISKKQVHAVQKARQQQSIMG
jgi:hypothetical protein